MISVETKIIKLEAVSKISEYSVVLYHGHFNIIHPGHIRYLDYARQQGTKLLVSIEGDKSFLGSERKHHFTEIERAEGVASIQTVDQVILLGERTLEDLIQVLNPAVLVLGKEFENAQNQQVYQAIPLFLVFAGCRPI